MASFVSTDVESKSFLTKAEYLPVVNTFRLAVFTEAATVSMLVEILHHFFKILFCLHNFKSLNGGKGNSFYLNHLTLIWWVTLVSPLLHKQIATK